MSANSLEPRQRKAHASANSAAGAQLAPPLSQAQGTEAKFLRLIEHALHPRRPDRDSPDYPRFDATLRDLVPTGSVTIGRLVLSNLSILGFGSRGLVLSATADMPHDPNAQLAVKLTQPSHAFHRSPDEQYADPIAADFMAEVSALQQLKGKGLNVPVLHEYTFLEVERGRAKTNEAIGVAIMDRLPGLNLSDHLDRLAEKDAFASEVARCWAQSLRLLHSLAEHGVAHNDFGSWNQKIELDPITGSLARLSAYDFGKSRLAKPGELSSDLFHEALTRWIYLENSALHFDRTLPTRGRPAPRAQVICDIRAELIALRAREQTVEQALANLEEIAASF